MSSSESIQPDGLVMVTFVCGVRSVQGVYLNSISHVIVLLLSSDDSSQV